MPIQYHINLSWAWDAAISYNPYSPSMPLCALILKKKKKKKKKKCAAFSLEGQLKSESSLNCAMKYNIMSLNLMYIRNSRKLHFGANLLKYNLTSWTTLFHPDIQHQHQHGRRLGTDKVLTKGKIAINLGHSDNCSFMWKESYWVCELLINRSSSTRSLVPMLAAQSHRWRTFTVLHFVSFLTKCNFFRVEKWSSK